MKYNVLRKLGIGVCVLTTVIGSSSVMASSLQQDTYGSRTDISFFNIYHDLQNHQVDNGTSFSTALTLSDEIPYGKAFYVNNSSAAVTITIKDKDGKFVTSTGISKDSSGACTWKGKGLYSINVSVDGGSENLNGFISTGISDSNF